MVKKTKSLGRGGKRKGAGRKPGSVNGDAPKDVNYNARTDAETLARLKDEARASGITPSELAGRLIWKGLEDRRKEREKNSTDRRIRALAYLVERITELVSEATPGIPWRDDPFTFESLRLSIDKFMTLLRPKGEMVTPLERNPSLKGVEALGPLESVEARSYWISLLVFRALLTAEPKQLSDSQSQKVHALTYGFADARRDLEIDNLELQMATVLDWQEKTK